MIRIYKATAQTLVVSATTHTGSRSWSPGMEDAFSVRMCGREREHTSYLEMLSASDVPFSSKEQEESSWLE